MQDDPRVPIHPLFAEAEDGAASPLQQPIETIDVRKFEPGSPKPVTLGWHLAADLTDEMMILNLYGPGTFELVGRPHNRQGILRKTMLAVGRAGGSYGAPGPAPVAPAPPAPVAAPAPAASGVDSALALLISEMRASREASERMMLSFAGATREQATDMVKAVSSLASARIADLTSTLREHKGEQRDQSSALERGAELYENTLAKAIALAEQLQARGGPGGAPQDVQMVNAIVDGIKAFKSDAAAAGGLPGTGNGHGGPTQ